MSITIEKPASDSIGPSDKGSDGQLRPQAIPGSLRRGSSKHRSPGVMEPPPPFPTAREQTLPRAYSPKDCPNAPSRSTSLGAFSPALRAPSHRFDLLYTQQGGESRWSPFRMIPSGFRPGRCEARVGCLSSPEDSLDIRLSTTRS